jgi:hypothetical protein
MAFVIVPVVAGFRALEYIGCIGKRHEITERSVIAWQFDDRGADAPKPLAITLLGPHRGAVEEPDAGGIVDGEDFFESRRDWIEAKVKAKAS